jgi:hypothetical protein
MSKKLSPRDRVPDEIAAMFDEYGVPDFYDGPMYTGRNGSDRTTKEVADLCARMAKAALSDEAMLEEEVAPLPSDLGQTTD